ncbi:ribonuclease HII [Synechococcus sp. RSCCF101]|nr:ribonuclease HII [Synechococcus sp. RSCCF101]QEY33453.1 ribonuclease HII [Synechococcus sp. RSCCF101]
MTAGVDEVGRGCLFGPVVASAVVLRESAAAQLAAAGLTDSKRLSPGRRAALVPQIEGLADDWALAEISAERIDALGIRPATEAAMCSALGRLQRPPDLVLVDGNLPLRGWSGAQRSIVGGDRLEMSIAAASVLAKQHRDGVVRSLAAEHPGYGLERHVGYATAAHRAALVELGPTPLHRISFLSRVLQGTRWQAAAAGRPSGGNRAAAAAPPDP